MKKLVNIIVLTIVIGGFLAAWSAQAQTSSAPSLTATIPFEFSVKNKTWPAGEYSVSCLNPTSSNRVLRLSRKDGGAVVVLQTNITIGPTRDDARIVFRRYGDQYFLAQVWMPADHDGLEIQKSRSEKEIGRTHGRQVRTATVALNTIKR